MKTERQTRADLIDKQLEPALRQPYVNVICALFKGTNKTYILDRKELSGNLLENVEDAIVF